MISAELPKYRCHKEVWALKIAKIESDGTLYNIIPEESGYEPIVVDMDFIQKHKPRVGGYLVFYKDGYTSYSPAKAFEEGYSRITEDTTEK